MSNSPAFAGFDPARRQRFERALNVAGAGTVLLQTNINRTVQQIHHRELGTAAVLPRKPMSGNAEYINRRTPGSSAEWIDDTTEPTEGTGTYVQVSLPCKTLIVRGKVTRKLQATGRSYGDVLAGEIVGRTGDFSETFEDGLVTGAIAIDAAQMEEERRGEPCPVLAVRAVEDDRLRSRRHRHLRSHLRRRRRLRLRRH